MAAFERARELLERGREGAAAEAAEEAKRLAPRSGAVRELLGLALYGAGRYRDSLREIQAYRRMTGRLDQNHLAADSYRAIGAPEKAVPLAREAIAARLPVDVRAEAAIVGAAALADLARYDEALGLLRRFPVQSDVGRPSDLRIWYMTGDVLDFAGEVSGGFQDEMGELVGRLNDATTAACQFAEEPALERLVFWCRPEVVAAINYAEPARDGRLRFPVFKALRPDVPPVSCRVSETE